MRKDLHLPYDNCGFKVASLQSRMLYEDYDDPDKVESLHQQEVADCVKDSLKASSVEILDYVVCSYSHHQLISGLSDSLYRYVEEILNGRSRLERHTALSNQHQLHT
jgi:hypothetical protein